MRNLTILTTFLVATTSVPAIAAANQVGVNARISAGAATQTQTAETRTSNRTWTVKARGDRNDRRSEVYDEALVKAAHKTLKKDYDWFRVINRETEEETRTTENRSGFEAGYERVPVRSCGLLTCRTDYRTERRAEFSINDERETTRYNIEIEFEAGWGAMPRRGETYDARLIVQELD